MKNQMKKLTAEFGKVLILLAVALVGVGIVSAWTGPTATPPGNNEEAPLNVSASIQTKTGDLNILPGVITTTGITAGKGLFHNATGYNLGTTGLTLGIAGKVGADQYCNKNGTGCKTIDQLGGGDTSLRITGGGFCHTKGSTKAHGQLDNYWGTVSTTRNPALPAVGGGEGTRRACIQKPGTTTGNYSYVNCTNGSFPLHIAGRGYDDGTIDNDNVHGPHGWYSICVNNNITVISDGEDD